MSDEISLGSDVNAIRPASSPILLGGFSTENEDFTPLTKENEYIGLNQEGFAGESNGSKSISMPGSRSVYGELWSFLLVVLSRYLYLQHLSGSGDRAN